MNGFYRSKKYGSYVPHHWSLVYRRPRVYPYNVSSDFITYNFGVYLCEVKISSCVPWRRTVEWMFSSTHPVTVECHSVKSASESEWAPQPVRKLWRREKYIPLAEIESWILGRPASSPYWVLAQSLGEGKRENSKSFWMLFTVECLDWILVQWDVAGLTAVGVIITVWRDMTTCGFVPQWCKWCQKFCLAGHDDVYFGTTVM